MKGLIKTSIIIAVLIGVGIVTSIIITSNLSNRLAAAYEYGFEEGRAQGYEVGFREGSKAGYQEGSKIGHERSQDKDISDEETGFYFTYNPTCDELQAILAESNKTTAVEINNFAEANAIRTAYVRCQIARKAAERTVYVYHVVAFDTVDNGLIII
ncbi:unnamed protein product, partial [marine sediment metagenome]